MLKRPSDVFPLAGFNYGQQYPAPGQYGGGQYDMSVYSQYSAPGRQIISPNIILSFEGGLCCSTLFRSSFIIT